MAPELERSLGIRVTVVETVHKTMLELNNWYPELLGSGNHSVI